MPVALEADAPTRTALHRLDEALARLREGARTWAQAPVTTRVAAASAMLAGAARIADRAVAAACRAKGIASGTPPEGEEWLASPYATHRFLRQTLQSLRALARRGDTPVPDFTEGPGGRLALRVFPSGAQDRLLFAGLRGDVRFAPGVSAAELRAARGRVHKERLHDGRVCLVLGAGNVNSIPAADVVTKLFNEGKVCLLKMNPVNAYMGPLLEEAFAEAIHDGLLAIVYGGADEGHYLAHHPAVDEVHITGSDRTHDALVWGPPGPERAERMARGTPLLEKEITSELGNLTPVLVTPGPWTDRELAYQADDVAGMVTHNASFNCIAGKVLVLPRGWRQRDRFLELVLQRMALTPARRAWYPGAHDRYRRLLEGRSDVRRLGGGEDALPWTLIFGLDPDAQAEPAFTTEPFCSVLSVVDVGSEDPPEFLESAVQFANERLWGTLAAALLVPGRASADPATAAAVERAIDDLRYGSVCVNLWPGVAYGSGTGPWGAYPGAPLTDIQSGRGLVHNTRMLEHVEKLVMRGPAWSPVKLPYFPSHRSAHVLGRRLAALEADGRWMHMPGVFAAALRG